MISVPFSLGEMAYASSLRYASAGEQLQPRTAAARSGSTIQTRQDPLLYWLLYQKLFPYFPVFRIFRYVTFRCVFASMTAMLIGLLIGPFVIDRLRQFQIGQYIREDGPQSHQKKCGTPTMGGKLICMSM